MNPVRLPSRFRVFGKDHFLILPRELWSSDKRIEFRSRRDADQFFKSNVRDSSQLRLRLSKLPRSLTLPPRNEIEMRERLGQAVYSGQLYLVLPDENAEKARMMHLASPRIRVKEFVQEARKTDQKTVKLTNPRWEHTDEQKKKDRPDFALVNDELKLMVDVSGVPDGTAIRFFVNDCSVSPADLLSDKNGKSEGGTAHYLWKAALPFDSTAEKRIEFCGNYLADSTDQCPIEVKQEFLFYW